MPGEFVRLERFVMRLLLAAAASFALLAGLMPPTPAAASAAEARARPFPEDLARAFRPHRAIYDVTHVEPRSGGQRSPIASARGRLVYEFMGSTCEGWTTNLRFVTELRPQEGDVHVSDIRSNTFEAADASQLRFVTRSLVNNNPRDESDGTARRTNEGIAIELRRPRPARAELTTTTLFPTEHILRILDAARAGQVIFESDVYDGSEGGAKVYATTAVMGRPIPEIPAGHPTNIEPLRGTARTPITISFFDKAAGQADATPLYELRVEVYPSGVTHGLVIDYRDFALRGTMTSLEILPQAPCP
jgi:hypothetical protein